MCSQWLSQWRGMQRNGPSSWSVILQDPDFAGLAHRTPGQLKDRCRSVLQYLIRAGVNPNDMQPWILGTPLGSLDRGRIPAEQMEAVLAAKERAYAKLVNPNGYQGYGQWNNEMMRVVRADSDSESDRSASPVVNLSASLVSRLFQYVYLKNRLSSVSLTTFPRCHRSVSLEIHALYKAVWGSIFTTMKQANGSPRIQEQLECQI
ncbi:hypothetical protein MIR68_009585 [Amoeboaphelidium protococcarum]|nr:hypothetical protein MIR68_009585 [Amoeboaphelidium protococcarum]